MRILIATDAFPPVCGGSGWSTYELARGLRARGHDLLIVRPRVGAPPPEASAEYDGFHPEEFRAWAPPVPFVRNYFKNERLYRSFETFLRDSAVRHGTDLIHAQHVLTAPPSVMAARALHLPVVCTVRDYWPVCYWSDLIDDRASDTLCPGCTAAHMTECVKPHAGTFWPMAVPFIPYMRANLAHKRDRLRRADAIVAVSRAIARDLRSRAPELAAARIETIHNPVDVEAIRTRAAAMPRPRTGPYALYVGKLEPNKGTARLIAALARARLDWPLVVVGDGSERPLLEAGVRRLGVEALFTGWRPRDEVLAWLQHAALLVFPSQGPESLSRVLLEASALGCAIAAMETGGTADIIEHEATGLLSHSAEGLGEDVARLRADEALRSRLSDAARRRIERIFDAPVVLSRMEQLYGELMAARRREP